MAKRAVSIAINKKHLTKAEKDTRKAAEESVKLDASQLKPAKGMTAAQRKIFRTLLGHLEKTGILSNLDADTLSQAAITIDRMHEIDIRINEVPDLVLDKDIMDMSALSIMTDSRNLQTILYPKTEVLKAGNM